MTALPVSPGTLKVQLGWQDIGDLAAMTVFHLKYSGGPPNATQCASMATSIQTEAVSDFASLLNEGSSIGLVTVTDLSSDMGGEGTGGSITPGTRTGTPTAAGIATVVSKSVARHYRGGHPRSYLPLGVAADISTGKWTSGLVGDVQTAWQDFIGACLGFGSGCTIEGEISLSYYHNGAIRATPVKDDITGVTVKELIGSQRRRNRKQ